MNEIRGVRSSVGLRPLRKGNEPSDGPESPTAVFDNVLSLSATAVISTVRR